MVLKVAWLDAPPGVRERAAREVAFYRDLAPSVAPTVPTMLAGGEVAGVGTALVLAALRPVPLADPLPWSRDDYVAVAAALGRAHAAWWGRARELDGFGWLRRERPLGPADLAQAIGLWRGLAQEPELADLLPPARLGVLDGYLRRLAEGVPAAPPSPRTLCHGDFHAGNTLRDDAGRWVIADWQEVGVGHGPADLAFFTLRARAGGSDVPVAAMFRAWGEAVEAGTGTTVDLDAARRVADVAELHSLILHWPAYLSGVGPDVVAAMLARIDELAGG